MMYGQHSIEILHFTDIHGAGFLFEEIHELIGKADLIIISGDITHFGKEEEARKIIETIKKYNPHILAVTGNCDYPVVETYLQKVNIDIHRKTVSYNDFIIAGISGSLPCPGTTPNEYTEEEIEGWLNDLSAEIRNDKPFLFVTHQPPLNTVTDEVAKDSHVGSAAIRKFIQEKAPILCFTGHIHEGIGVDSINTCQIINPGPFRTGKYAQIIITDNGLLKIDLRQITVT